MGKEHSWRICCLVGVSCHSPQLQLQLAAADNTKATGLRQDHKRVLQSLCVQGWEIEVDSATEFSQSYHM